MASMAAMLEGQRRGTHILIVEDDLSLAELLQEMLSEGGLRVDAFSSGERALRHLAAAPWPDLFLVDLALGQEMSGESLVQELRRLRGSRSSPILLMTGTDVPPERLSGLEVEDFLAKPFALEQLVAKLEHLLARPLGGGSPQPLNDCELLKRRIAELEARLESVERYARERGELVAKEMVNAGASLRLAAEAFHRGCAGGAHEPRAPVQADALRFRRSSEWMVRLVRRLLELEARARGEVEDAPSFRSSRGGSSS